MKKKNKRNLHYQIRNTEELYFNYHTISKEHLKKKKIIILVKLHEDH